VDLGGSVKKAAIVPALSQDASRCSSELVPFDALPVALPVGRCWTSRQQQIGLLPAVRMPRVTWLYSFSFSSFLFVDLSQMLFRS